MSTLRQQLNIKKFPFEIRDANGRRIYYEDSRGIWVKSEYDANGYLIYHEDSRGFWSKSEYDANGKEIYFENSEGEIIDNRATN
jgi:hypothetical protein